MRPRAAILTMLVLAASCAGRAPPPPRIAAPLSYKPVPDPPEEAFRASPPPLPPLDTTPPAKLVRARLAGGLEIVHAERSGLPLFSVRLVIARGARDLPATRPELLSLGMLALAREHRFGGESAGASCDQDGCTLFAAGLSGSFEATVAALGEMAMRPRHGKAWQAPGFRRELDAWYEAPGGGVVETGIASLLFLPDDAYGPLRVGAELAIAESSVKVLTDAYERLFQPEHATLVVSGDIPMERVQLTAQKVFEAWAQSRPALPRRTDEPVPVSSGGRAVLIDRRGILVHGFLFARGPVPGDPDVDALTLLSAALGARKGRLHDEVRSGLGAAYAFSTLWVVGRARSWLAVGGPFELEKARPAMSAVAAAVRSARDNGLAEAEIHGARNRLVTSLREQMSTTRGVTALIASSLLQGLPADEILGRQERLARVTSAPLTGLCLRSMDV